MPMCQRDFPHIWVFFWIYMCNQPLVCFSLNTDIAYFCALLKALPVLNITEKETNRTMDITMSTWLLSSSLSETPCKHQVAISIDMEF
jgi:hypothetical protein